MVADYKNMERLFRENVPKSRLDLVLMEIDEITPDNILETVKKVEIDGNDTLVFYYSGHAANDAGSDVGSGGHYFQIKDEIGKPVELQRRTLLASLKDKKARMTVLLTDCCNIEQKSSEESKEAASKPKSPVSGPPKMCIG